MPREQLRLVQAWIELHRDELVADWELADGRKGIFDMKPYLDHGIFRELRDMHCFNQAGVVFGAVTWPHE